MDPHGDELFKRFWSKNHTAQGKSFKQYLWFHEKERFSFEWFLPSHIFFCPYFDKKNVLGQISLMSWSKIKCFWRRNPFITDFPNVHKLPPLRQLTMFNMTFQCGALCKTYGKKIGQKWSYKGHLWVSFISNQSIH